MRTILIAASVAFLGLIGSAAQAQTTSSSNAACQKRLVAGEEVFFCAPGGMFRSKQGDEKLHPVQKFARLATGELRQINGLVYGCVNATMNARPVFRCPDMNFVWENTSNGNRALVQTFASDTGQSGYAASYRTYQPAYRPRFATRPAYYGGYRYGNNGNLPCSGNRSEEWARHTAECIQEREKYDAMRRTGVPTSHDHLPRTFCSNPRHSDTRPCYRIRNHTYGHGVNW